MDEAEHIIVLKRSFADMTDERRIKSYIEQTLAGVRVISVEPRGPYRRPN